MELDPPLEREADEAAQQAMAEGPVVTNRMGCEMQIQSSPFTRDRQTSNPLNSNLPADGGGLNEVLGLLANEGVYLDEENIRDVLAMGRCPSTSWDTSTTRQTNASQQIHTTQ